VIRVLLFLSLVGAGIYALLVVTHDVLPSDKAEDTFAGQTQSSHPVGERLSAWGPYLPRSLSQNPQAPLATSQQPAPSSPQQTENPSQNSERKPGADYQLAASEASRDGEQEPVERAKVVLAAEMHSQASVSSPVVRFYRPGTALQVVRREGGWFQVSDPVTQERGWVFEKYLSSIEGSSPTQVAMESTTEPLTAKPALPKSKKRSRSAKPAVRVVVAKSDPWSGQWARRGDQQRGFAPFMFGPFARFAAAGR
jgi:hypothetical protein